MKEQNMTSKSQEIYMLEDEDWQYTSIINKINASYVYVFCKYTKVMCFFFSQDWGKVGLRWGSK